jgi:hypothetical protein
VNIEIVKQFYGIFLYRFQNRSEEWVQLQYMGHVKLVVMQHGLLAMLLQVPLRVQPLEQRLQVQFWHVMLSRDYVWRLVRLWLELQLRGMPLQLLQL